MNRLFRVAIALSLGLLFFSPFLQAQLSPRSISIFKDGTAFVVRAGTITPKENQFVLTEEHIPEARFGTLWFQSPTKITGVSSYLDSVARASPFLSHYELLQKNVGKSVRLRLENNKLEGVIKQVSLEQVLIQGEQQWTSLPLKQIVGIDFFEAPVFSKEIKQAQRQVRVDFAAGQGTTQLEMLYLRGGLGWLPHYLVELTGEDQAQLTLSAEVINDGENLENTEVNFVVGVPDFRYGHLQSALVSRESLFEVLNQYKAMLSAVNSLAGQQRQIQMPLMNQAVVSYDYRNEDLALPPGEPETEESLAGTAQEDLFFYTLPNVTLPKGGRGLYEVLTIKLPVEHLYEARIGPNRPDNGFIRSRPSKPDLHEVQHKLKFTNSSQLPWTTGTAMVTQKRNGQNRPLSQNRLNYTPSGEEVKLPLTIAPDITVTHTEEEISREENEKRVRKISYDLVTMEGEIELKNHKNKSVTLHTRRLITGILDRSQPKWLIDVRSKATKRELNPRSEICWEVELEPGEELTVSYRYQVYVPR